MSRHTPGPWAVVVGEYDSPDIYPENWKGEKNLPEPGYGLIARVSPWDGEPERVPEAKANARLIAAAPDLLAALEMVRDADNDCRDDGLPCIPALARGAIDGAIAKATGEQP